MSLEPTPRGRNNETVFIPRISFPVHFQQFYTETEQKKNRTNRTD